MMCWKNKQEERRVVFNVIFYSFDDNLFLVLKKGKNMWIMFEKLYRIYVGSTTWMCFIQFLKHDPHIFAYNILDIDMSNETE